MYAPDVGRRRTDPTPACPLVTKTYFKLKARGLSSCACENTIVISFSFMEAFQKPENEPRVVRFREHPHLGGRIDRVAGWSLGRESPCRRRLDVRNTSHRCTYARGSTGILHIIDESNFRAIVRVLLRQPSPPFVMNIES